MKSDIVLGPEYTIEIQDALRRNDVTPHDLKQMTSGDFFAKARDVVRGHASITTIEHVVDYDANPYVPEDWSVEEHRKGGQIKFEPARVGLYLDESQKNGKWIKGHELRKKLVGLAVYNANLLDFYLANPQFIPEEWKGKLVFFWGTIYRDRDGNLFVRYLHWYGDRWYWNFRWLVNDFYGRNPAALRAS